VDFEPAIRDCVLADGHQLAHWNSNNKGGRFHVRGTSRHKVDNVEDYALVWQSFDSYANNIYLLPLATVALKLEK
jgi:hypothetical protein